MKKILLTGEPRVGKSTILKKIVEKHNIKDYILAREIRKNDERIGFELITPNRNVQFAFRKLTPIMPRVGSYWIDLKAINDVCIPVFEKVINNSSFFVFDEFGAMQMMSPEFRKSAYKLLDSGVPLLASITKTNFPWVKKIKSMEEVEVIEVSKENRNRLAEKISTKLNPQIYK